MYAIFLPNFTDKTMTALADRHILLALTGGIASYKSIELCRLLVKAKANVRVVMTKGAQAFVTPLTLQAVSQNPVHSELLDESAESGMGHIELAKWAEFIIIAPASCHAIAKISHGLADDLLSTLCLASKAKLLVAPAMNQQMWLNSITQENVQRLRQHQVSILGPAEGEQACGDIGPGRMLEPLALFDLIKHAVSPKPLRGKTITITAGPTQEAIDPVRYISNHSSGKMGFAIAQAAACAGANVNLIVGPVALTTPLGVNRYDITSADEMLEQANLLAPESDIFVGAAAVADYKTHQPAKQKIKKSTHTISLELVKNPDIVGSISLLDNKPFMVGFAAETEALVDHAKQKLHNKQLDLIVANDVSQAGIGFNSDDNAVTIISQHKIFEIKKTTKLAIAEQLIELIAELIDY